MASANDRYRNIYRIEWNGSLSRRCISQHSEHTPTKGRPKRDKLVNDTVRPKPKTKRQTCLVRPRPKTFRLRAIWLSG